MQSRATLCLAATFLIGCQTTPKKPTTLPVVPANDTHREAAAPSDMGAFIAALNNAPESHVKFQGDHAPAPAPVITDLPAPVAPAPQPRPRVAEVVSDRQLPRENGIAEVHRPFESPDQPKVISLKNGAERSLNSDLPVQSDPATDFADNSKPSDPLQVRLAKRAADNPQNIDDQLNIGLYSIAAGLPIPGLPTLSALSDEDREIYSALMDALSNFESNVRDNPDMMQGKKIEPLREGIERIAAQANLTIDTMKLCRHVEAYGKYDLIEPLKFTAGRENKVIVYCQVQNFRSQLTGKQEWETHLAQQIGLYSTTGHLMWSEPVKQIVDECHSHRHDFYTTTLAVIPSALPPGKYTLKVTIQDLNADRRAVETMPLTFSAQSAPTDDSVSGIR